MPSAWEKIDGEWKIVGKADLPDDEEPGLISKSLQRLGEIKKTGGLLNRVIPEEWQKPVRDSLEQAIFPSWSAAKNVFKFATGDDLLESSAYARDYQRSMQRALGSVSFSTSDILFGQAEEMETLPGVFAGAGADLLGFIGGPAQAAKGVWGGFKVLDTMGRLNKMARVFANSGAHLGIASGLAEILPALTDSPDLGEAASRITNSTLHGTITGLIFPIPSLIPGIKNSNILRSVMTLALVDQFRSHSQGQWSTFDDFYNEVSQAIKGGEYDKRQIGELAFSYAMDLYFGFATKKIDLSKVKGPVKDMLSQMDLQKLGELTQSIATSLVLENKKRTPDKYEKALKEVKESVLKGEATTVDDLSPLDVIDSINKGLEGKSLGVQQQRAFDLFVETLRQDHNIDIADYVKERALRDVRTSELQEGDRIETKDGVLRVLSVDSDHGLIRLRDNDGRYYEFDESNHVFENARRLGIKEKPGEEALDDEFIDIMARRTEYIGDFLRAAPKIMKGKKAVTADDIRFLKRSTKGLQILMERHHSVPLGKDWASMNFNFGNTDAWKTIVEISKRMHKRGRPLKDQGVMSGKKGLSIYDILKREGERLPDDMFYKARKEAGLAGVEQRPERIQEEIDYITSGDSKPITMPRAIDIQHMIDSGGFTMDLKTGQFIGPKDLRYSVSTGVESKKYGPGEKLTAEDITKFIEENQDLLMKPNHNLGGWINPETGEGEINVSVSHPNLFGIYYIGKKAKVPQISLWDHFFSKEITFADLDKQMKNLGLDIEEIDIRLDQFRSEEYYEGKIQAVISALKETGKKENFDWSQMRGEFYRAMKEQGISIEYLGITPQLTTRGYIDWKGTEASTIPQIASIGAVVSNPKFENFWILFIKGGKVVDNFCYTSGLPAMVKLADDSPRLRMLLQEWKRYGESVEYDEVVEFHNHPDGNPLPSGGDKFTHEMFKSVFGDKFKGSMITEGNQYSFRKPLDEFEKYYRIEYPYDPAREALFPKEGMSNINAGNLNQMIKLAKEVASDDRYYTIITKTNEKLQSISKVDYDFFENEVQWMNKLKNLLIQTGGMQVVIIGPKNKPVTFDEKKWESWIESGYIFDILDPDGTSLRQYLKEINRPALYGTELVTREDATTIKVMSPVDEFWKQDIVPKSKQILDDVIDTIKTAAHLFAPRSGVEREKLDKIMQMKGVREKAAYVLDSALEGSEKAFSKMPQTDLVDFIDRIKTGQQQQSPKLQQVADLLRQMDDNLYEQLKDMEIEPSWMENHFRLIYKIRPGNEGKVSHWGYVRPLEGSKGFMKKHVFETLSDAMAEGGVPISFNPITLFKIHAADVMRLITARKMFEQMKEMGAAVFVRKGSAPPDNYTRVDDRMVKVYLPIEKYGKYVESETHSESIRQTRDIVSESVRQMERAETRDAANKVEEKVKEALERRGWSPAEADQILRRVKNAPAGPVRDTIIERTINRTIEKVSETIKTKEWKPGKGSIEMGEWYMDEGVSRILNNFLSRDAIRATAIGRTMMGIKNFTTAVELSLNLFHFTFETIETASSAIGLGMQKILNVGIPQKNWGMIKDGLKDIAGSLVTPVGTAREGGSVIRFIRDKSDFLKTTRGQDFIKKYPELEIMIDDLFTAGAKLKMHEDYRLSSLKAFQENISSNNYIGAAVRSIPALQEALMKPLFDTYIPRLKLGMFMKEYAFQLIVEEGNIAAGHTSRAEVARKVWDFVENRLGEMNFDNLFWNRTFKTSLQLLLRSVTWKLGNIRAFGQAVTHQATEMRDAYKEKRAPRISQEMAWVWGMAALTAAIGATLTWSMTGDPPDEWKDYIFPQYNKQGDRLSLPTYARDFFSMMKSPTKYAWHSTAGMWGRFLEVMANKDFYGYEIADPEDLWITQKIDQVIHTVPIPFGISSMHRMSKAGEPVWKLFSGFVGFTAAPAYINMTEADELASEIIHGYTMVKAKPEYKKETSETIRKFSKKINEKMQAGEPIDPIVSEITKAVEDKKISLDDVGIIVHRIGNPLENKFRRLSFRDALLVWQVANDEEKKRLKPILEQKFLNIKNFHDQERYRQEMIGIGGQK